MKYVTADIHGCYEQFMKLLELINFSENDTLYILGDIIDRGPEPLKMIRYVMSHDNIKMLKGNHEDMMCFFFETNRISDYAQWEANGGKVTYKQLMEIDKKELKEILDFMNSLPFYFIVDDKILVHAGISKWFVDKKKTDEENMKRQKEDDLMWVRDSFIYSKTGLKKTIIFGHTPTPLINNDIFIWYDKVYNDKINIDCACVFGGNLACINLDTMEEFYVRNKNPKEQ